MRKYLLPVGITFLVAAPLSATFTLSVLRTVWGSFQMDLVTWWSIVSTLLNFMFICFSIWQYWEAESQKMRSKSQIKIWMQDAKGIVSALHKVQTLAHTKISDVCNAISMVEASASAMFQSLYEERVVKEEDYQETEKRKVELVNEQEMMKLKKRASSMGSSVLASNTTEQ